MTGIFRSATFADAEAILGLMREYYADEGYPFAETDARRALVELVGAPMLGRVWIADGADAAAAYVVLTFGFSLEYGGRDAFLDDMYVAPAYRRQGFGTSALALVEAACRDLGVRALHLEVERHKGAAQVLYRGFGFVDRERYLMTKLFTPSRETSVDARDAADVTNESYRGVGR
jgi:ribosomal protein S18 acetylase RimI-like enzyme